MPLALAYLTFDPKIPLPLWVLLAVLAAALLVMYAVLSRDRLVGNRRAAVLALMGITVALPLALLLNPTWIHHAPPPAGKPLLSILVDVSASMATEDGAENKTRLQSARQLASDAQKRLSDQFEVQIRQVDSKATPLSEAELQAIKPSGQTTDLARAIEETLDERTQGQAILLLSDGIHNAGGGAARVRESVEKARAMAVPIYTMTLGGKSGVRDLDVSVGLPQEMAFVGQQVPVTVQLRQRGALSDRVGLSLSLNGKTIEERTVDLKPDGTVQSTFQVSQPESGLYRYEIKAAPIQGEVTSLNNNTALMLRVINQPVRVLLLEGKPYWDTKFLVRTLAADQSIELTSIVRMTADRYLERTITRSPAGGASAKESAAVTPTSDVETNAGDSAATEESKKKTETANKKADSSEKEFNPADLAVSADSEKWDIRSDAANILADSKALNSYQIILLGRDSEIFLNNQNLAALKKWLSESDGSLVCFRGAPAAQISQRLGELMPVGWTRERESRFRVQLTESGQSMHWLPSGEDQNDLLSNLPSLASAARPQRAKPLAIVLAKTSGGEQDEPVITYQPVGNGRVVTVEGAGMWRWAFLPPKHQQHDDVYGQLWRSLTRWLVTNVSLLPSQKLALRSDKASFGTAEVASATLLLRPELFKGDPPVVNLIREGDAQPQSFTPVASGQAAGQFRIVFGKLPPGVYKATVAGDDVHGESGSTVFDVRGNLDEQLDVAARPDLMKLIADTSGGAVFEGEAADKLGATFAEHIAATQPLRIESSAAWDRWWALAAICLLWATSWTLRRRSGLV